MPKRSRLSKAYHDRKVNTRELVQRFLIICEGEQTEPNYFKSFRVPKDVRYVIKGFGKSTENLIEEAMKERKKAEYDQVWCVFDKDDFSNESFNAALQLAKDKDIKTAYCNQAFELWYLLHFNYYDSAIPRKEYITKLETLLEHKYEKNSTTIYQELFKKQEVATTNATKLLAIYSPSNPAKDDPSTTVHLLVAELNKFVR